MAAFMAGESLYNSPGGVSVPWYPGTLMTVACDEFFSNGLVLSPEAVS